MAKINSHPLNKIHQYRMGTVLYSGLVLLPLRHNVKVVFCNTVQKAPRKRFKEERQAQLVTTTHVAVMILPRRIIISWMLSYPCLPNCYSTLDLLGLLSLCVQQQLQSSTIPDSRRNQVPISIDPYLQRRRIAFSLHLTISELPFETCEDFVGWGRIRTGFSYASHLNVNVLYWRLSLC